MLAPVGMDLHQHPTQEALEAYLLGTLPEAESETLETHVFFCADCRGKLFEEREFITSIRVATTECLIRGETMITPVHRFTHDTDDGLIESEVTRAGPEEWLARHWGPLLDGGQTTSTLGAGVTYLIESFQQMFPEHVCTAICLTDADRRQGTILPGPTDS